MIRLTRFRLLVLMVAANFVVAGSLVAGEAYACSCALISTPEEELEYSAAVFSGTVTKVKEGRSRLGRATFDVKESWKGVSGESVSVYGHGDGIFCGLNYDEGKSYLVYAERRGKDDLKAAQCTSTKLLSKASEDLRALGPPESELPETGGPDLQTALATLGFLGFAALFAVAVRRGLRS